MLKRVLSIVLSAILCAAMFASGVAEEAQQVKLYYPSYLQESEGEALVLDKMPERIVCLSNAALQILVRCGIQPVLVGGISRLGVRAARHLHEHDQP